jgi:uncharacterized protein (TIGR03435 family)
MAVLAAALPIMIGQAGQQTGAAISRDNSEGLPAASFEVVSIHQDKPSPDGRGSMQMDFTPNGTLTALGLLLKRLICAAYGVSDIEVVGGPEWLTSDRYTIEAKADSATQEQIQKLSGPQMRLVGQQMVKGLLADRFKLKMHEETKEIQILAIVPARNGPKLHASMPGDSYANGLKDRDGQGHAGMMRFNGEKLTAQGVPLDNLASLLSEQLHQIVQNKTGLKGNYDFVLEWTPERDHDGGTAVGNGEASANAEASSFPSIYTAIQEQLGLKLESQKAAIQVFVIDQVERPTED